MVQHKLLASLLSDQIGQLYAQYEALSFTLDAVKTSLSNCCYNCPQNGSDALQNTLTWMSNVNSTLQDLQTAIQATREQMNMQDMKDLVDSYMSDEEPDEGDPAEDDEDEMASEQAASKNPDDYLVVGDKTKSTTWHLQVKKNGNYDRTLCGAAYAALTVGYRGNKYEGPDKTKALKKLKSIYKQQGWDLPSQKS